MRKIHYQSGADKKRIQANDITEHTMKCRFKCERVHNDSTHFHNTSSLGGLPRIMPRSTTAQRFALFHQSIVNQDPSALRPSGVPRSVHLPFKAFASTITHFSRVGFRNRSLTKSMSRVLRGQCSHPLRSTPQINTKVKSRVVADLLPLMDAARVQAVL